MRFLILFVAWGMLFVLCWPIALIALVLLPLVWLASLPFRFVGMVIEAAFALVRSVLFLPARLMDWRKSA